jgi:hypothetical protein
MKIKMVVEEKPMWSSVIKISLIVILTIILLSGLYFFIRRIWGFV